MRFSIFDSVRAQHGELCTYDDFLRVTESEGLLDLCKRIAACEDKEERGKLKKHLPIITWQAYFAGRRVNAEAEPSGLFMLDIDHVDDPYAIWSDIVGRRQELGILFAGKTASCKGLRIVAKCRPEFSTIAECQKWLADEIGCEYDAPCKDFARSSYVVHASYTYFMDAKGLFQDEPEVGTVYAGGKNPFQQNAEMEKMLHQTLKGTSTSEEPSGNNNSKGAKSGATNTNDGGIVDQREGLFGGSDEYKGVKLSTIAREYLEMTGGMPQEGERNTRLFKLATRMRYVCDFNEARVFKAMPNCGLGEEEIRSLVHSAMNTARSQDMPRDLQDVLDNIDRRAKIASDDDEELPDIITSTDRIPSLPPLIREWAEVAPADFKAPAVMCLLPILGALGSKLRAVYLDGKVQSPSFLVSLEAPQASGKSFMVMMSEYCLKSVIEHDEIERMKEREYQNKASEMKMLNIKITPENKDEILGQKPKSVVRYVPATMSITKLLQRMDNAQGLHLFALAEEVDTVVKAFKRGFSSYSDLLRVSFDNGLYGQDYASDNSFSGIIPIYYNMLCSGTPKAMRRMYPDVEDGTTSRVCFVTLPDQFGKPMPVWKKFDERQKAIVDMQLVRLDEVSIINGEVQNDHMLKVDWLNKALKEWVVMQQQEAVKENDRTRDIFLRRAAVVGFRAGMLSWFLWGEKGTPTIRKNVCNFAIWVANNMLNQHLLRFNITETHSNVNKWEEVYAKLGDKFSREDLEKQLAACGKDSPAKMVLYKWKLLGAIKEVGVNRDNKQGKKQGSLFEKIKK